MATPKFVTDASTAYTEANMNRGLMSDGTKIQVKVYHAHILYNGASWEVVAADDSSGIVTGDLAWSTDHLVITVSGFTNPPIPVVSGVSTTTTPAEMPQADIASNTAIHVFFFDDAHANVSTEGTTMDFTIILIGF